MEPPFLTMTGGRLGTSGYSVTGVLEIFERLAGMETDDTEIEMRSVAFVKMRTGKLSPEENGRPQCTRV